MQLLISKFLRTIYLLDTIRVDLNMQFSNLVTLLALAIPALSCVDFAIDYPCSYGRKSQPFLPPSPSTLTTSPLSSYTLTSSPANEICNPFNAGDLQFNGAFTDDGAQVCATCRKHGKMACGGGDVYFDCWPGYSVHVRSCERYGY